MPTPVTRPNFMAEALAKYQLQPTELLRAANDLNLELDAIKKVSRGDRGAMKLFLDALTAANAVGTYALQKAIEDAIGAHDQFVANEPASAPPQGGFDLIPPAPTLSKEDALANVQSAPLTLRQHSHDGRSGTRVLTADGQNFFQIQTGPQTRPIGHPISGGAFFLTSQQDSAGRALSLEDLLQLATALATKLKSEQSARNGVYSTKDYTLTVALRDVLRVAAAPEQVGDNTRLDQVQAWAALSGVDLNEISKD